MVAYLGDYPRCYEDRANTLPAKRLLFIGTCQVGPLQNKAHWSGMTADHLLCETFSHSPVPPVDAEYDATIIGLTVRHIHMEAAHRMDGAQPFGNCFYWPRLVANGREQEYFDICAELVTLRVNRLCSELPGTKFIMSFIQPRHNYLGTLLRRYHLSNPVYFMERLNQVLAEAVEAHAGAHLLDCNEIISMVGNLRAQDDYVGGLGHAALLIYPEETAQRIQPSTPPNELWESLPATDTVLQMMLQRIVENLEIIEQPLRTKAIIVDLDDTLWRGIAADDDKPAWEFAEVWPVGVAEALLIYKARGGMLAICSKNDETTIRAKFDEIWHGRLSLSDFASVRINFDRKSENVRSILSDLNVLPESVLFIDDNPREIDDVAQSFPSMQFMSAEHFDWRRQILMSPSTQVAVITEDAALRTQSIQAKAERTQLPTMDRQEWLESLKLQLEVETVGSASHARFERAFELLNKTNQFNTTGRRWERDELVELLQSGGRLVCGMLRDRVANYGMVGVVIVAADSIEQMVLSCRAFGNNAEHALAGVAVEQILGRYAQARGSIIDTGRNKSCHRIFSDLGFQDCGDGSFAARAAPPTVPHIAMNELVPATA